MKHFWSVLSCVLTLTVCSLSYAFSQTPPTELEGSFSPTDNAIELRWHVPEAIPGPAFYNVYRKEASDPSFQLLTTASDRRHDDEAIVAGTTYQYRVTAVYSGAVESTPTNIVTVQAGSSGGGGGGSGSLPPRNLVGHFDDRGAVELDWFGPDSMQSPSLYNVYRKADGEPLFTVIGTAPEPEFDDTVYTPFTLYRYYVTALYNGDVESVPSNIVEVFTSASGDSSDDSSHSFIHFTSTPPVVAFVGEEYTYQPVVTTNPPGVQVCFELHDAPSGASMDPLTGSLTWTPTALGNFEVEIRARACSGSGEGEARQEFHIMVVSGTPGQLHGTVLNVSAQPIPDVRIKIFDVSLGVFVLRTRTDSSGAYQFPFVNPGTYFIRADVEGDLYEDVWFDGVQRLADATPVSIQENGSVTVNFTLQASDEDSSQLVTFSGVVNDSSSNPIGGAKVTAFTTRHRHGDDDDEDDDHDDFFDDDHHHGGDHHGDGDDDHSAITDSSGAYHMTVRAGNYFVRAKAAGFFEQFWDMKNSILEANILSLHQDTTNINFSLIPGDGQSEGTGSISGFIYNASDSLPVRSHVTGFRKNSVGHYTRFTTTTRSDSAGFYTLDHLPAGFYIVLAKAEDEFIPTFYSLGGGTPILDSASLVSVGSGPVPGIDIYLRPDSAEGLNSFSGEIEYENETPGKTTHVTPFAINPLAGAIVVVKNSNGQIAGSTLSDQAGSYRVPGLAPGNYTLTFQKPGNVSAEANAALSYVNNTPSVGTVNAQLPVITTPQMGLMGVRTNWNLVAVPVETPDLQKNLLFPGSISEAYSFSGTYQSASLLEYGTGYWLKFPGTQVIAIPGSERVSQSVPLAEGWNLVGSLTYPVETSSLTTVPSGIVSSSAFGYEGGYRATALLEPGKGYWIKASTAGTLTMEADFNSAKASKYRSPAIITGRNLQSVTLSDEAGNSQTLFFGSSLSPDQMELSELPPPPPAGAFDVRFSSGRMIEIISRDNQSSQEYPLSMQLVGKTITITWSEGGSSVYALKKSDETVVSISTDGSRKVTIGSSESLKLVAQERTIPAKFALHQNYPNPFNPVTTIAIDLPVASNATVKIYNLIGQELETLIDRQELSAGVHTVRFDANRLASGVYLYRLEATNINDPSASFTQIKKMVLIK